MSKARNAIATAVFIFAAVTASASSTLEMQLQKQRAALVNGDPDVSLAEVMILKEKIEVRNYFIQSGFSEKDALNLAEKRRAIYEECLPVFTESQDSTIAAMVKIILASDYCRSLSDSATGFSRDYPRRPDDA